MGVRWQRFYKAAWIILQEGNTIWIYCFVSPTICPGLASIIAGLVSIIVHIVHYHSSSIINVVQFGSSWYTLLGREKYIAVLSGTCTDVGFERVSLRKVSWSTVDMWLGRRPGFYSATRKQETEKMHK